MPKHVYFTKYFRECSRFQSNFKSNSLRNPLVYSRNYASVAGGGGGRPNRSGRPPTLPPYPEGLVIGVCGRRHSDRTVFVISQIHMDEIAAVTDAVFYADPELQEKLKEKRPYLFYEEFNNDFRELKAWAVTEHTGWIVRHGIKRLVKTKSYCYKFMPEWLEKYLSFRASQSYTYIDESSEAHVFLERARTEDSTPLYHWQSRNHIDIEPRVKANSLTDGYLLDNRKWHSRIQNVVPKCVPSILDIAKNPKQHKGNPFAKLALSGRIRP